MSISWDDELTERLKALHEQRYSAGMIAKFLGRGISRCSVLGKLNRLGLKAFARQGSIDGVTRLPRKYASRRPGVQSSPPLTEPLPLGGLGLGLAPGLCQYIHGDPLEPPWRMCGHETGHRYKSYCPYHMALCKPPKASGGKGA
jgi:hypothetical protein